MKKFLTTAFGAISVIAMLLVGCDHSSSQSSPAPTTKKQALAKKNSTTMDSTYSYLYGLNSYRYADLIGADSAKVMVIDVDDSKLTTPQVKKLRDSGKVVFSYLSIGEAENYREYWRGWEQNKPGFLLEENSDWQGNFRVKFWDKNWQDIILKKAEKIAQMGFSGVYLDIIDGYQQASVIRAYFGNKAQLRQEMENFVIAISNRTKKINPRFKVIPQNAVELVADAKNNSLPNQRYLQAIDGLGVEDLWYDDDTLADWTKWDLKFIHLAQQQGKFVLATSYPKDPQKQAEFINKALKAGFIPFAGKRALSKRSSIYPINQQIPNVMPNGWTKALH